MWRGRRVSTDRPSRFPVAQGPLRRSEAAVMTGGGVQRPLDAAVGTARSRTAASVGEEAFQIDQGDSDVTFDHSLISRTAMMSTQY